MSFLHNPAKSLITMHAAPIVHPVRLAYPKKTEVRQNLRTKNLLFSTVYLQTEVTDQVSVLCRYNKLIPMVQRIAALQKYPHCNFCRHKSTSVIKRPA